MIASRAASSVATLSLSTSALASLSSSAAFSASILRRTFSRAASFAAILSRSPSTSWPHHASYMLLMGSLVWAMICAPWWGWWLGSWLVACNSSSCRLGRWLWTANGSSDTRLRAPAVAIIMAMSMPKYTGVFIHFGLYFGVLVIIIAYLPLIKVLSLYVVLFLVHIKFQSLKVEMQ